MLVCACRNIRVGDCDPESPNFSPFDHDKAVRYDRRHCSDRMPSPSPKNRLPTLYWLTSVSGCSELFLNGAEQRSSALPPIYRVRCNFRQLSAMSKLEAERRFTYSQLNGRDSTTNKRGATRIAATCDKAPTSLCAAHHRPSSSGPLFFLRLNYSLLGLLSIWRAKIQAFTS